MLFKDTFIYTDIYRYYFKWCWFIYCKRMNRVRWVNELPENIDIFLLVKVVY